MSKEERKTKRDNENETSCQLSRREFLKDMGLVVGGVTIASLAMASSCSNTNNTNYTYIPPTSPSPTLTLAEGASIVASDRKYSIEHIWVKLLGNNRVLIGITDKLRRLVFSSTWNTPTVQIDRANSGLSMVKEQDFGAMSGDKMTVDLISPVSGEIVQSNYTDLLTNPLLVITDPYNTGWMEVVKLSNPKELNDLMTAEEYASFQSTTGSSSSS